MAKDKRRSGDRDLNDKFFGNGLAEGGKRVIDDFTGSP